MRLDRLTLHDRAARAESLMLAEHGAQGVDPDGTDPMRANQTARILAADCSMRDGLERAS